MRTPQDTSESWKRPTLSIALDGMHIMTPTVPSREIVRSKHLPKRGSPQIKVSPETVNIVDEQLLSEEMSPQKT